MTDALVEDDPVVERWNPRLFFGASLFALVADQLTKWWARTSIDGVVDVFWTLKLHVTQNSGASFSLGLGRGQLIGVGVILISIMLIRFARTIRSRVATLALGLVLGGALGNLTDRLFGAGNGFLGGSVTDFIELFPWWPIFNVADIAIVGGVIVLIVVSLWAGEDGL